LDHHLAGRRSWFGQFPDLERPRHHAPPIEGLSRGPATAPPAPACIFSWAVAPFSSLNDQSFERTLDGGRFHASRNDV
jgi:hypothetical protein